MLLPAGVRLLREGADQVTSRPGAAPQGTVSPKDYLVCSAPPPRVTRTPDVGDVSLLRDRSEPTASPRPGQPGPFGRLGRTPIICLLLNLFLC